MRKKRGHPLVIALTGGIGSGKSTVAHLFAKLGVPLVDADVLSRELVKKGRPLLKKIVAHFGKEYLDQSGNLDRRKLRHLIFTDPKERFWLEKCLHPAIYAEMKKQIKNIKNEYIVCIIPLLFEKGIPRFIDKVLVVDADKPTQIARIMQRDKITTSQAKAMLKTQVSRQARLKGADDVIKNKSKKADLKAQVKQLDAKYRFIHDILLGMEEVNAGHVEPYIFNEGNTEYS